MDPVQEIKAKLSIEDLVAPYVPLKRSGKYLKACCPFHQEKTPSFYVSPERQLAYCFSCHKGGDLFQFIQDIEGLDFRGALELLAEKAHIELPKFSGKSAVSKDLKDRLKLINRDASKFFVQNLWTRGEAEKVVTYLLNRGLTEKILKTFEIGFSPEEGQDGLYRHLLAEKHEKNDILDSTVCLARDSESKDIVDRFRLRLMVPIENAQGETVGFGGRALKKGVEPKYLNSADYVLYNKSQIFYNLAKAKNSIREKDFAVIVEGYFDVMASWQAGVQNTVATCGTALTEEQVKLLKRYTSKLAFAFKADNAGHSALLRAIQTAQPFGLELFVITIPEGKDAADAVKKDPKLWVDSVEARKPYLDFFLEKIKVDFDLAGAQGKRQASDFFLEILKGTVHPVERDHYLKELSKLVGTPSAMLYDYLGELKTQHGHRSSRLEKPSQASPLSRRERLARYLLGLVLAFPAPFFKHFETLADFAVFEEKARALGLVQAFNKLDPEKYAAFYRDFPELLGEESSVYKQVRDHYNAQDTGWEDFLSGLENGPELQKLAMEAEVQNTDPEQLPQEFEKVLTNLYFETIANGTN